MTVIKWTKRASNEVEYEDRNSKNGSLLIKEIERRMPHRRAWLNTCEQLKGNVRLYQRHGFIAFDHERINDHLTRVFMEKNIY